MGDMSQAAYRPTLSIGSTATCACSCAVGPKPGSLTPESAPVVIRFITPPERPRSELTCAAAARGARQKASSALKKQEDRRGIDQASLVHASDDAHGSMNDPWSR